MKNSSGLFTRKNGKILDVGGVGEEVEGFDGDDFVFVEKEGDVAGLGGGVARKIDDFLWGDFEEFVDEAFIAAGTRWIQDYCLTVLNTI